MVGRYKLIIFADINNMVDNSYNILTINEKI